MQGATSLAKRNQWKRARNLCIVSRVTSERLSKKRLIHMLCSSADSTQEATNTYTWQIEFVRFQRTELSAYTNVKLL